MTLRKIFNTGKEHPEFMALIAMVYNVFSFTRIRIKGRKNIIDKKYSFLRKNKITIIGSNNKITFGLGTRLYNCKIYICGENNRLFIGDNCYCSNSTFYFEDYSCEIRLGNKTRPLGVDFAATEPNSKILVGDDCLFSSDVDIRTGDSHSIIDRNTNRRINYAKNVTIGNHVWVGAHARILKGSSISDDSVVANSAVVTKEFKQLHCIIGGVPAKILKENIHWENERIYEER